MTDFADVRAARDEKREWAEGQFRELYRQEHHNLVLLGWSTRLHDGPNVITSTYGYAVAFDLPNPHVNGRGLTLRRTDIAPEGTGDYDNATQALYLIDNGETITPHYVLSFNSKGGWLNLRAVPVAGGSFDPLTPRRAYHVRVREARMEND